MRLLTVWVAIQWKWDQPRKEVIADRKSSMKKMSLLRRRTAWNKIICDEMKWYIWTFIWEQNSHRRWLTNCGAPDAGWGYKSKNSKFAGKDEVRPNFLSKVVNSCTKYCTMLCYGYGTKKNCLPAGWKPYAYWLECSLISRRFMI